MLCVSHMKEILPVVKIAQIGSALVMITCVKVSNSFQLFPVTTYPRGVVAWQLLSNKQLLSSPIRAIYSFLLIWIQSLSLILK